MDGCLWCFCHHPNSVEMNSILSVEVYVILANWPCNWCNGIPLYGLTGVLCLNLACRSEYGIHREFSCMNSLWIPYCLSCMRQYEKTLHTHIQWYVESNIIQLCVMRFLQQHGSSECQAGILLNGSNIRWRLLNTRQNFQCSGWLTHQAITVVQLLTRLIPADHPVWLSGRSVCLSSCPVLTCISYVDCVWIWFIRITFGPDIKIWQHYSIPAKISSVLTPHAKLSAFFFF